MAEPRIVYPEGGAKAATGYVAVTMIVGDLLVNGFPGVDGMPQNFDARPDQRLLIDRYLLPLINALAWAWKRDGRSATGDILLEVSIKPANTEEDSNVIRCSDDALGRAGRLDTEQR